jgi:hypothetical protein
MPVPAPFTHAAADHRDRVACNIKRHAASLLLSDRVALIDRSNQSMQRDRWPSQAFPIL